MAALAFDTQNYNPALAKMGLKAETVASTPLPEDRSAILINPKLDPRSNPDLAGALKVYGRHYLASQEGIPGEGETIDVVLSRLQGNDDNVARVSVIALKNEQDKVVGVAFVESYEIDAIKGRNGAPDQPGGLAHLLTYAAVEGPYEKTEVNVAFHAAVMKEIANVDKALGYEGNSILATEVNATRDFEGQRQSDTMAPEFEIKTGAPRELREAYVLGGGQHIIPLEGKYNTSQALGVSFAVPNLGGEEEGKIPTGITNPADLAPYLVNPLISQGVGEVLFLTAESPYHVGLTSRDVALHQAFQQNFNVSVAQGNHDIGDKSLIIGALEHSSNQPYRTQMAQYDEIVGALRETEVGTKPPTSIAAGATKAEDVGREPPQQQVQK